MSNIVTFPEPAGPFPKRRTISIAADEPDEEEPLGRTRYHRRQHLLFRSRESILASDEEDLIRDVCSDIDRAEGKLKRIQQRLKGVQQWAAAEILLLTAADTKLSAAIVAALLSGRR
jgi:hypothetical protein